MGEIRPCGRASPAVALARHFRGEEGLSIAQIAERLSRSPATIKAYFYDPTGEKARAIKARYVGVPRLRRRYAAAQRQGRFGGLPASDDWSATHARRAGERCSHRAASPDPSGRGRRM